MLHSGAVSASGFINEGGNLRYFGCCGMGLDFPAL